MIRINKFLSQSGVTSRRGAEKLIIDERVEVNEQVVKNLGLVIDEETDVVKVDGKIVKLVTEKYYILLNKPKYVLTSLSDPFKRKTVSNFIRKIPTRIYPIGRLDFDTDGILLMTNDGELAYRLAHPKYRIRRVYHAIVEGTFTSEDTARIAEGVKLEDGHTGSGTTRILTAGIDTSKVEVILTEGHKREVKQLLKAVNHQVLKLRRIEFAGIKLGSLKWGQWRHLTREEIASLKSLVDLE